MAKMNDIFGSLLWRNNFVKKNSLEKQNHWQLLVILNPLCWIVWLAGCRIYLNASLLLLLALIPRLWLVAPLLLLLLLLSIAVAIVAVSSLIVVTATTSNLSCTEDGNVNANFLRNQLTSMLYLLAGAFHFEHFLGRWIYSGTVHFAKCPGLLVD